MARHVGIVACSAEGAALCYRTLCAEAPALMGEHMHPEVSMHTHALGEYMVRIRSGNWRGVADLMLSSARHLAAIGAQFAICPDNTIHEAFDLVAAGSPIPWLHIAEAVAREAGSRGIRTLAITGTKYLMTGPVYPEMLSRFGISCMIPEEADRERIDEIIFGQLVNGLFTEESRVYFNTVIRKMRDRGCDGVVLGCTEIPLLVDPNDCPLPTLDSTRLLARAALREALKGNHLAPDDVLQGTNVYLRLPRPAELSFIRTLWSDPETMAPVGGPLDWTETRMRDWFARVVEPGGSPNCYCLFFDRSDTPVGEVSFHDWDSTTHSAELNIKTLAAYRGRGYAKDALETFLKFFFGPVGGQTMVDSVALTNRPGRGLLESVGFVADGTVSDVCRLTMSRQLYVERWHGQGET